MKETKYTIILLVLSINVYCQKVGIGSNQFVPVSTLDVMGNMTIGGTYAANHAATANGLIVEGNVGIGSIAPGFTLDVSGHTNIALNKGYWIGGSKILWIDGTNNLFCGAGSAAVNTGSYNSFVGVLSGAANTTGSDNAFLGTYSGSANTTGSVNTSIGYNAGSSTTTGSSNTFIGAFSAARNTDGSRNVYVGQGAGYDLNGGTDNVILGYNSLYRFGVYKTPIYNCVVLGSSSGTECTGNNNILIGSATNTDLGDTNAIAIGSNAVVKANNAMALGGTGVWAVNVGIGTTTPGFTLDVNGHTNIALNKGYWINANKVLWIDGNLNLFCGAGAAGSNTGSLNTFVGNSAGAANTSSSANSFFGGQAGISNTTGAYNTFLGVGAGIRNVAGGQNVYVGCGSGYDLTGGSNNVIVGYNAAYSLGATRPLNNCVALGSGTAVFCNGDNNIMIGTGADMAGAITNSTAIGSSVVASASNTMVFGNSSVKAWGFGVNPAAGRIIDVNTGLGSGSFMSSADGLWYNTSDKNAKENFEVVNGQEILEKIQAMPILKWNYKNDINKIKHIGPMAQDFYGLYKLGVDDKSISTIDPAGISLAAIQELCKQLKEKDEQIKKLEERISRLERK